MFPGPVYRAFGAEDRLLYVGIAVEPQRRLDQHRSSAPWWPEVVRVQFEELLTRADAERAERQAIDAEGPAYNDREGNLVTVRLFPDERAALKELAEQQERSMAWLGRHAIRLMLGLEKPEGGS